MPLGPQETKLHITEVAGGVTAPLGFKASGVAAGIKPSGRPDLALLYSERSCAAAAVVTSNRLAAAPVHLTKKILAAGQRIHAVVINSGNANACTGEQGHRDAEAMVDATERWLELPKGSVLVNSTGLIGHHLPMSKIVSGIEQASIALSDRGGARAAEAIMTTDSRTKEAAVEVELGGRFAGTKVRVGGMAKGAGMIAPNMATMIGVITTDAELDRDVLDDLLRSSVGVSFNQISVDGCQSTNDMVIALANGAAPAAAGAAPGGPPRSFGSTVRTVPTPPKLNIDDPEMEPLAAAFAWVCRELAKMIARDGEGATKLIEVEVAGAKNHIEARRAALAVVSSDLVKSAFFGNDPNWGRILAAVGGAQVELDPDAVSLEIAGHRLVAAGQPLKYDADAIAAEIKKDPVHILVGLGAGTGRGLAWGCDLTYDYVKINAEYTT